ncbi:DUF4364 family protein [Butyrivibrio sp. MB2005]|uniref:DUF4364 family protein n=1 Tax=Butyrivibrio sp. MB2005 TaxID=1280678 RepID=UPI000410FC99|nr:DUF4364 family protein [Butyrivibrio sp. MB2005]
MSSQYLTLYKMIVLYMLKKSGDRLSKAQIYDFILENEYTNFLTLQEVFSELAESGLITESNEGSRTYLRMTKEGDEALGFFENRINPDIRTQIDEYFKENGMKIRDDSAINAHFKKTGENEYVAYLSASEGNSSLIEMSIPVWTESMAESICENWKKKNQSIYQYLIKELM